MDRGAEEGGQPPLPLGTFHFLLPCYLMNQGTGDPKGVWLRNLSQDFLVWWRSLLPPYWNPAEQRYYRNPWTDAGQMRDLCEQCPGVEVVDMPTRHGALAPVVRLTQDFKGDPKIDGCPMPPPPPNPPAAASAAAAGSRPMPLCIM